MLYEFLQDNEKNILAMTDKKSHDLAGLRPSSAQLKEGLPIFFKQLMGILKIEASTPRSNSEPDKRGMSLAADKSDEQAMAQADGRPDEAAVAKTAGLYGKELLRLGYTLSHVVHAYGSICQSITELATQKSTFISASEFHDLNRCLDIAIAGAVTEYHAQSNTEAKTQEIKQLGFLAHELRNALGTVKLTFQLIKEGTVGLNGNVGYIMERGLDTIETLIERSLTEVRMRVDPTLNKESVNLLQLVNQILVTAAIEARTKNQTIDIQIDPAFLITIDHQLFYSALSNLIQNALKYTRNSGKIQVRALRTGSGVVIEVEDECGGLPDASVDLFAPYQQESENRSGLGLGLTIAQKAMALNRGQIEVQNLPGKGCIFRITIPSEK